MKNENRPPAYKLVVSYDGQGYAGWQLQSEQPTVQGVLEQSLEQLAGRLIRVQGSGRTDAGVHARGQVVSFDGDLKLPCDTIRRALNARLPLDVRVLSVEHFPNGFHALRNVLGKRYRYLVQDGRLGDVFQRHYSWRIHKGLDDEAMAEAAAHLVGEHDFAAFQATGADRKSTVRHVTQVDVQRLSPLPMGMIAVDVAANGFLYNMVRIIVGSLVAVGMGKHAPQWLAKVLAGRARELAGQTAPAEGLCLMEVW